MARPGRANPAARVPLALPHLPLAAAFDTTVTVAFADGSARTIGAGPPAAWHLRVRDAETLSRLLAAPSLLAIGEAFVGGEIDVGGDLLAAIADAYRLDAVLDPSPPGSSPATPDDAAAIAHHYDIPTEFYRLFLDPRLLYTCAYYRRPEDDLETAQTDKLERVCRKLRLRAGEALLDLGCGWGGLAIHAAERYGVVSTGVTLSAAQAAWARDAVARAGQPVTIRQTDWAALAPRPQADAVSALGLLEHVGPARYDAFFQHVRRLLCPGGRLLVQTITRVPSQHETSGLEFLRRYVFPGGGLATAGTVVAAMERSGFQVQDVEAMGAHYARTTRHWVERLQASAAAAQSLVGERGYRTWLGYLAAASVGFAAGFVDVHQVVAVPAGTPPGPPSAREPA